MRRADCGGAACIRLLLAVDELCYASHARVLPPTRIADPCLSNAQTTPPTTSTRHLAPPHIGPSASSPASALSQAPTTSRCACGTSRGRRWPPWWATRRSSTASRRQRGGSSRRVSVLWGRVFGCVLTRVCVFLLGGRRSDVVFDFDFDKRINPSNRPQAPRTTQSASGAPPASASSSSSTPAACGASRLTRRATTWCRGAPTRLRGCGARRRSGRWVSRAGGGGNHTASGLLLTHRSAVASKVMYLIPTPC